MSKFINEKSLRYLYALFPSQPVSHSAKACVCVPQTVCMQGKGAPATSKSSVKDDHKCMLILTSLVWREGMFSFILVYLVLFDYLFGFIKSLIGDLKISSQP